HQHCLPAVEQPEG
nr:immunoglobulin heavy chain junction region [Homo sapiens]